ncbi:unnamed protein product [Closterium sp. NIES-53]
MEVAHTSMIHAAAPHFLWPFVVRYDAHQLNLWPRVSLGNRAFVRDTYADKLSSRAIPCVFLGFPPDAPGWQFYHPTSCRVLPSQDVMFDESVPYRTAPLPPPATLPHSKPPSGAARGAASGGAARGAASGGAASRGTASGGAEPASAEPGGAEP